MGVGYIKCVILINEGTSNGVLLSITQWGQMSLSDKDSYLKINNCPLQHKYLVILTNENVGWPFVKRALD